MRSTDVGLRRRAVPPPSTAWSVLHSTRHRWRSAPSTQAGEAGEAGHRGAAVKDQPAARRRLSRGQLASVTTVSSNQGGEEFLSARIALGRGAGRQPVAEVLDGRVRRPGTVRIDERTGEAPWTSFGDRLRERSHRGPGASQQGDLFACTLRASRHVIRPFEALRLMVVPIASTLEPVAIFLPRDESRKRAASSQG